MNKSVKNTQVDFKDLMIGFRITSIDHTTSRCNVTVGIDGYGKKNFKDVLVSGLLNYKLKSGSENYSINHNYVCSVTEKDWTKGPFQLVRFADKQTGEILFMLTCVNERSSKNVERKDPFGNTHTEKIYRFRSAGYYRRYRDLVDEEAQKVDMSNPEKQES